VNNPSLLKSLEILQQRDIRSAMDQLQQIANYAQQLNLQINDIQAEVEQKVNLISRSLEGNTYINIVGSGTVTTLVSNTTINGTNTLFTKELKNGWSIKIGNESFVIHSITNDTILVVDGVGPTVASTNALFGIIKPITKEQLIGDFQFGNYSDPTQPFRGVINPASSLEHYGRIATPKDIVNVEFVTKQLGPIAKIAARGISRYGDNVGGTDLIDYLYSNCSFTYNGCPTNFQSCVVNFDGASNVTYEGTYVSRSNIATKGNVDDAIDSLPLGTYASYSKSDTSTFTQCDLSSPDYENNIGDYFSPISPTTLSCVKNCTVLICASSSYQTNNGGSETAVAKAKISIGSTQLAYAEQTTHGDVPGGAFTNTATATVFAIHRFINGNSLVIELTNIISDAHRFDTSVIICILSN